MAPPASLRVQALARRLAGHPNCQELTGYAAWLDARILEWGQFVSQRELSENERTHGLSVLANMRRDFNALLVEADQHAGPSRSPGTQFGTALDQLEDSEIAAISDILGLPFEPRYRPAFEVKAAEYLEQDAVFVEITEQEGFVDQPILFADERHGAVVLTYSGSLLLISAPLTPYDVVRRYIYQSIYASPVPVEAPVRLLEPVTRNQAVVGTKLRTSPVRKIRVARRLPKSWEEQRDAFLKFHRTMRGALTPQHVDAATAAAPRKAMAQCQVMDSADLFDRARALARLAAPIPAAAAPAQAAPAPSAMPSVFVQALRAERQRAQHKQQEEAARAELRAQIARLVEAATSGVDHALEAEILGQNVYLQRLVAESGALNESPTRVRRIEIADGASVSIERGVLVITRAEQAPERVEGGHFGPQEIVQGAPLVVLGRDGGIVAVLGNVSRYQR